MESLSRNYENLKYSVRPTPSKPSFQPFFYSMPLSPILKITFSLQPKNSILTCLSLGSGTTLSPNQSKEPSQNTETILRNVQWTYIVNNFQVQVSLNQEPPTSELGSIDSSHQSHTSPSMLLKLISSPILATSLKMRNCSKLIQIN